MPNFHSDEWIMNKMKEHYEEALKYFPEDRIVGIFCQGSTNYGLDTENSDVDTKLIVVPSFEDVAFNRKPVSTTHVRENDEHIDFKDIRLMFSTFRKQNINFIEVLFTKYKILNPRYESEWNRLVEANEMIAHYNLYAAVRASYGCCLEKYHAMEHKYPAKVEIIEKYGYDPKQLHHLARFTTVMERFIKGVPYSECIVPDNYDYIYDLKMNPKPLEEARKIADFWRDKADEIARPYIDGKEIYDISNPEVDELLDSVQLNIMRDAFGIK